MFSGHKEADLGVYFGSIQVSSCIRTSSSFYKIHLSEDDELYPILYIKTKTFGKEVIPYILSDPRNVLSHFQMLLGKTFNEVDLEKYKKYVSAELVEGTDGGYEFYVESEDINIPVTSAITMLFRELAKLLVLSDGITKTRKIVVTVPLKFTVAQKISLKNAILDAGFSGIQFVSDTKAALQCFQDFVDKDKHVLCICCDYCSTSVTYFSRSENGAWIAEKNFYPKYVFLEYITSFAETIVRNLWGDIKIKLGDRAGEQNDLLPCVIAKLCQIIANQAKAYSHRSTGMDWNETIAFRYKGEKFSQCFSFKDLEVVVNNFCEELINDLKCAGDVPEKRKRNAITSLRGITEAAFICIGDCFLFPQVQSTFIEYMKSSTVRGMVAIQRYSFSLNEEERYNPLGNVIVGNSPQEYRRSSENLRIQELSHIIQSSPSVESLNINDKKVKWASADVLSMGAIRSAFDSQVINSLQYNITNGDTTAVEIVGKTEYDIGFLIPDPSNYKNEQFFLLIEKNTKYPFISIGNRANLHYQFSRHEDMTIQFYEKIQSSMNGSERVYISAEDKKSYKLFKQYKLLRDEDHPHVPRPETPQEPYDSAEFRNTEEYKRYKESRKKCLFTIDCRMSEDGILSACMRWVDTRKQIKSIDLSQDEREIEKKMRAIAFLSQNHMYYPVSLIIKQ